MDDEMVLHLRTDNSILAEFRENGVVQTKFITADALFESIRGSTHIPAIHTGLLPPNILSVRVGSDDIRYAVVEWMGEKADITYASTVYTGFPLPRLLFGFYVTSNGRISHVDLGVPALGKLSPDTPMFFYPLSNVMRFSLCTGSNPLPHIKDLRGLQNLPDYILSLPDNDDRFSESNNQMKLGHRDLMEHLQDKNRQYYYEHVLVPMPQTTLKNFLQEE